MNLQDTLDTLVTQVVEPLALAIDTEGRFPREAVTAAAQAGLLGLTSATEVGGQGQGLREAAQVVSRLAQACPSTAMVVCMHYCANAVIEAHGPRALREAVAAGRHFSTLAFSEAESRSHFWAPVSTARTEGDTVVLDEIGRAHV